MKQAVNFVFEEIVIENIRIKATERECPGCDSVLMFNETEQCFECLKCGYIDCGNSEE